MTSQIIQFPPLHDFNKWVNFWYHDVGVNVIPTDDLRHDTPFIPNPDPMFNRAVGKIGFKPDISNIKIRSTDSN
jgi:hypothetical protein